jgi:hypothetical protein
MTLRSSSPTRSSASPEAESKEKQDVWGPYAVVGNNLNVKSRVHFNTFTMGNPMPELTLTICQSRLYRPVRDLEFGHC